MATKNDEKILKLKKEIEKKKSLLSNKKFTPVTNCNLVLDGNRYNLHVTDKEQLLILSGKLISIKNALKDEFPDETLTISSSSVDDWIKDIKARFNSLNVSQEEKRLKELESKLHTLLSLDTKVELEIDNLESQI